MLALPRRRCRTSRTSAPTSPSSPTTTAGRRTSSTATASAAMPTVDRCPETTRLLDRAIPGMETAMFSILAPAQADPAPRRPVQGRAALPPRAHGARGAGRRSAASGSVPGHPRAGGEGKSLVFDDTYEHEAWNDTDGTRVVLFVDVVRPAAPALRTFNAASSRRSGARRSSRTPSVATRRGKHASSRSAAAAPDGPRPRPRTQPSSGSWSCVVEHLVDRLGRLFEQRGRRARA